MDTPAWALTLAYWLHMTATVVWVGGLATLALFALPAARKALDGTAYTAFLAGLQRRFDPLAWFSLAVLAGTGMFQMSANPGYQGFLAIQNRWAVAILIKHILFFAMTGISAYLTWGVLPALQRMALLQGKASPEKTHRLQAQERRLLRLNLILGIVILALTAIARAA